MSSNHYQIFSREDGDSGDFHLVVLGRCNLMHSRPRTRCHLLGRLSYRQCSPPLLIDPEVVTTMQLRSVSDAGKLHTLLRIVL